MLIDCAQFRSIADQIPDEVSGLRCDLESLYRHFGLPPGTSMSLSTVTAYLYGVISSSFATDVRILRAHLALLHRQLIAENVLSESPLEPYLVILECIQDAARPATVSSAPKDDWTSAIACAFDHVRLSPHQIDEATRREVNCREFVVAHAAKRLRDRGYGVLIGNGSPVLDEISQRKAAKRLDEISQRLCGARLAGAIFEMVKPNYDTCQERYHVVRRLAPDGQNHAPQVPFGHLLMLAAKHPFCNPVPWSSELEPMASELMELARDLAATFDVEPYSTFEVLLRGHTGLIPFLQELATYDTLFTIPQMRPRDSIVMTRGLLAGFDLSLDYDGSWNITQALSVASALMEIGKTRAGPIAFEAARLTARCSDVPADRVRSILDGVFAHPAPGANAGYLLPTIPPPPDFMFHPVLADGKGRYLLLGSSACAPAIVEALFSSLRGKQQQFDRQVGHAAEAFLREQLQAHGVEVISGEYACQGEHGECDILVETPKTVLIFEMKKKALTRAARAGSDVAILVDLAQSLLEAQLQAGRREIALREHGFLMLKDATGRGARVDLKGRDVERIAVSLLDFGSFQDRVVLRQFLEVNLNVSSYSSSEPVLTKRLEKLQGNLDELRRQIDELARLCPEHNRSPFFNCWFLSVPQLLVLLDSVHCSEDLRNALWQTRHITTGSLDFYFDHAQMMKIRAGHTGHQVPDR